MKRFLKYCFLFLTISISLSASAQFDTLGYVFKPRIGIGAGTLTYYGEIQNYQKGFYSGIDRMAGNLFVNAPLTKYLNLEFSAFYGKVSANERTLERNLNFESRIRMNSIMLHYNFYPLFKYSQGYFSPYFGIGFASFEFLSKTDLHDANGNMYHYWSDGSIMNLPENHPSAINAIPLTRDYKYETDIREQNFDSLGKYREQSFAFPMTLGAQWQLTPRVDFRLSATYYFTFTDLIDGIHKDGIGDRVGDKRKDHLLYSNATISYDLEFLSKGRGNSGVFDWEDYELAEFENNDFDKDGVIDALDLCPNTPVEALVDKDGCPLDTDKDGVPDYIDEEPNTPFGNYVNKFGVTISEEEFRNLAELFWDSTGTAYPYHEDFKKVTFTNKDGREVITSGQSKDGSNTNKNYVVIIGKEHKEIAANQLHKYLGYSDFKTVEKGDTIYYVLGEYDNIEDAVAAKTGLEKEGINVELIGRDNNAGDKYIPVQNEVIEKVDKINVEEGRIVPTEEQKLITQEVYRVQLGAFKNKINIEEVFPGVPDVIFATGEDGITRYYTGSYKTFNEAETYRKTIRSQYPKSFVVAYKEQVRVTLKEAGVDENNLPENYNEEEEKSTFVPGEDKTIKENNTNNNNVNNDTTETKTGIDMSKVKYRVVMGNFESEIPVDILDIYMTIGGVRPVKNEDNSTTYYSKGVSSADEANELINQYTSEYKLSNLKITVEYLGKYYTEEEFKKLQNE